MFVFMQGRFIPMGTNCAPLVAELFLFCMKETSILLVILLLAALLFWFFGGFRCSVTLFIVVLVIY